MERRLLHLLHFAGQQYLTPEPHQQACRFDSHARTRAQGELDERDVRELNEAVVAVEERLHQAW